MSRDIQDKNVYDGGGECEGQSIYTVESLISFIEEHSRLCKGKRAWPNVSSIGSSALIRASVDALCRDDTSESHVIIS